MVVAEFLQEISDRKRLDLDKRFRELNMNRDMESARVFEGKLAVITGASRSMFCHVSGSSSVDEEYGV